MEGEIALANQADIRWKSWKRIHSSDSETHSNETFESNERISFSKKRVAFIQDRDTNFNNYAKRSREDIQCFECKEFGHIKRFCPQKEKLVQDRESKECTYCFRKNNILKEKHEKERENLKRKLQLKNLARK